MINIQSHVCEMINQKVDRIWLMNHKYVDKFDVLSFRVCLMFIWLMLKTLMIKSIYDIHNEDEYG